MPKSPVGKAKKTARWNKKLHIDDKSARYLRMKNRAVLLMLIGLCAILYLSIILKQKGLG